MNKWLRDVVLIPLLIAIATGFAFMLWGASYSGVQWHSPFAVDWLRAAFSARVPVWGALLWLCGVAALSWLAVQQRLHNLERTRKDNEHWQTVAGTLKQQKLQLEDELAKLKSSEPKLHGVWEQAQCFWHMGSHGTKPMMQIGGWINLSSSNTKERIFLLGLEVNGVRSSIGLDVVIEPTVVQRHQVIGYIEPPLEEDVAKPYTATIRVEDHRNRWYSLPEMTFRATPPPTQSPYAPATADTKTVSQ